MLPSFRLIAVTFLCGFVLVFAGLRLATSLNDVHEGVPVMAARAAPVTIADAKDRSPRSGAASPIMYDLHFAVSTASQAPVPINVTALVIDRAAPLDVGLPLSGAPLEQLAKDTPAGSSNVQPAEPAVSAKPAAAVAAIAPQQPASADVAPAIADPAVPAVAEPTVPTAAEPAVPAAAEAPAPIAAEPAASVAAEPAAPAPQTEAPKPDVADVAAVDPQPAPTPDPVTTGAITPNAEARPATDDAAPHDMTSAPAAAEVAIKSAAPAPVAPSSAAPSLAINSAPHVAKAAPRAVVRKKRTHIARHAAPAETAAFATGAPSASPFGLPSQ